MLRWAASRRGGLRCAVAPRAQRSARAVVRVQVHRAYGVCGRRCNGLRLAAAACDLHSPVIQLATGAVQRMRVHGACRQRCSSVRDLGTADAVRGAWLEKPPKHAHLGCIACCERHPFCRRAAPVRWARLLRQVSPQVFVCG